MAQVGDGMCEEGTSSARAMLGMGPLPRAAPSWLCLILLLSSICNFSNGLEGTNYSRKTVMQRRPRSSSATGHSGSINHTAPMWHRWWRELLLLAVGQSCSPCAQLLCPPP